MLTITKVKPHKIFFISVGLLYIIFLMISFFTELGNVSRLRMPYIDDIPNNNYIPFSTIVTYILNFDHYNLSTWFFNTLGNILIFFPLGIIAPILFNKIYLYKHIIYITILIRGAIEVLQYNSTMGVFDVDDIILSLVGSLIGFHLYVKSLDKNQ
ncbi:VanZ family protein [Virgibacillus salexigens]|uniref:VanZ family protein n=1 Tax=Virgibacillus salexigens TaxID=61016 RepID=UPI0034DDFC81